MPGKKAKGKTVSLQEFHAQHEQGDGDDGFQGGDWADDVPDMEEKGRAERRKNGFASASPNDWRSAPSSDTAGGSRFSTSDKQGAARRQQGGPIQWPDKPPFTAFVGNFAFEVTESDLVEFFEGAKNARVMRQGDQSKGYGYVEFNTVQDLKEAVERSDEVYKGRKIRVDVTDPKDSKGPGAERSGFNAQATTDWRSGMGMGSAVAQPRADGPGGDRPPRREDRPAPREQPNFSRDIFGGAAREAPAAGGASGGREPAARPERTTPAFSREALGSGLRGNDDAGDKREDRPVRERVERATPAFSRNEMGSGIEAHEQSRKEREDRDEKKRVVDDQRKKERESKGLTYSTDSAPTRDIFGGAKPAAAPAAAAPKTSGAWERGAGGYSASRPFRDDARASFRDREDPKPAFGGRDAENGGAATAAPRRDWRSSDDAPSRGNFRDRTDDVAPKQAPKPAAPTRDFNFRDRDDAKPAPAKQAAAAPSKPAPSKPAPADEPSATATPSKDEKEPAITDWDAELDVLLPQDK
eukprot:gene15835-24197_t